MAEQIRYNRGDISEAIYAAAIAARYNKRINISEFKNSKEPIRIGDLPSVNRKDIESILRILVKNKTFNTTINDIDIKQKVLSNVFDNIQVSIAIPTPALIFLQDESNWTNISNIFTSAQNAVNQDTKLKHFSYKLSVNMKSDTILIQSVGTKNQRTSKVDIEVSIISSGKTITANKISLKYVSPQISQSVGIEFENFGLVFNELELLPNIDINKQFISEILKVKGDILGKKFTDRDDIKKSKEVQSLVVVAKKIFDYINLQLNSKLNNNNFNTKLAGYCINQVTQSRLSPKFESGIELVKFSRYGGVVSQKFDQSFIDSIKETTWKVFFNKNGRFPLISIYSGSSPNYKNTLIKFRYRIDSTEPNSEGFRKVVIRTYVESGDLLYTINKK